MGKGELNQETMQNRPKAGCFPTSGAWQPAMVGFGPMPATIPVGTAAPPGVGGSHRLAAPLSAAGMETAASWL